MILAMQVAQMPPGLHLAVLVGGAVRIWHMIAILALAGSA
jgi:hypothetical protein